MLLLLAGLTNFFTGNCLLAQSNKATPDGEQFHPTRIIAKFKAGEKAGLQPAALKQQGLKVSHQFNLLPQVVVLDLEDEAQVKVVQALQPQARAKGLRNRIAALQATGRFEYVEPDYIRQINVAPTDAAYTNGTLWALHNIGQDGGMPGADIGVLPAWDITTGSTNVIVAIVDTGIRYTHDDLAAQMWHNPDEIPDNNLDDDGNGYTNDVFGINAITSSGDPMDDNGHGTHVAGIIGAAANDGNPNVGVTWNVRLMACKFLAADGHGYFSDEIECLDYARSKGARIINASFGSPFFSLAEYEAIKALSDAGVLLVAAAGNQNNFAPPGYPAAYNLRNVIAVVALDRNDNLAQFSNIGRNVSDELGAPGVDIYSCWCRSDADYVIDSGTSMAAPYVTGAAALVLSQYPNATLTELRRRLLDGVVQIPALTNYTAAGGRLNVYNSLTATPTSSLQVESFPSSGESLVGGQVATLLAVVSDIVPVTNAVVTAGIPGFTNLTFLDNGVSPDAILSDGVYTANFVVPTNLQALNLNLQVSAPGRPNYTNQLTYAVVFPPPNDNFLDRIPITDCPGVVTGSCLGASIEPGEPFIGELPAGGSVWWSWTAPTNEPVMISASGSYAIEMAVYTGQSVSNLNLVAADTEFGRAGVSFNAVAGAEYEIGVAGITYNVSLIVAPLASSVSLADALDCAALSWSGDWLGQTCVTHDGVAAARSRPTLWLWEGDSVLNSTVVGPGRLSFWWKVSTSGGNNLGFWLNGLETATIWLESDWQQVNCLLASGTNNLQWVYSKTILQTSGADAGWVDEVSWVPGGTAPSITNQPVGLLINPGNDANFSVGATGTPPLQYQWRLNGVALTDATNTTLVVTNVHVAQTGDYSVVVSNDYGSVTSAVAVLSVMPDHITITCDDEYDLYLNGVFIGNGNNWQQAQTYTNLPLHSGTNIVAVHGVDMLGLASLLADMILNGQRVGSSVQWKVSLVESNGWNQVAFDDSSWLSATEYGAYGVSPWYRWVAGMPTDTLGRWIWSANNDADNAVYFRYTFEVNFLPALRLTAGLTNGLLCLQIYSANGQSVDPQRVPGIEVYATTNLSLNMSNWVRLTNSLVLTNGVLLLADPEAALLQQRFYRTLERP
ncbi:MAG: S8 family serine peptidase [Verrucomicrobiota bacterium]|jgi:subtilisin family serine protease